MILSSEFPLIVKARNEEKRSVRWINEEFDVNVKFYKGFVIDHDYRSDMFVIYDHNHKHMGAAAFYKDAKRIIDEIKS